MLHHLVIASSQSPKIEEVNSKSKFAAPKYKIIREPPEGRPEFLVIEITLPGIVSASVVVICLVILHRMSDELFLKVY